MNEYSRVVFTDLKTVTDVIHEELKNGFDSTDITVEMAELTEFEFDNLPEADL